MTAIAAVLDSALGRGHVPDWVRGALYADPTRAPRGVSVWLGRYGGTNPGIDLRSRRLFDLIDVFDPDAFVVTLRVGFLVAQLVASQEDDAFRALAEPGRSETTVPVWPGGRVPRWPPERALSDRNFEELSHLTPP